MADDYRHGMIAREIVRKYNIEEAYRLTSSVAKTAVYFALQKLITSAEERLELGLDHQLEAHSAAGRLTGPLNYENNIGCFALPKEILDKYRMQGAQRWKEMAPERHAETSACGKEGAKIGTIARGMVPWSDEERAYCLELGDKPEYFHKSGTAIGRRDYNAIARALKEKFGTNRTVNSLKNVLNRGERHYDKPKSDKK
jgi:hypothetical protein